MFDALCPPEWAPPRKRLCVVLVSENTPYHDEPRQALREFAQEAPYSTERVRFAYVFQERQTEFVSALANGMLILSSTECRSTPGTVYIVSSDMWSFIFHWLMWSMTLLW